MNQALETTTSFRPGDHVPVDAVPLMNLRDVLSKLSEWGKEYPILLTLQVRTGALSTALREFGSMCLRAENYELAVEVYLAAVSMRPDNCWLWHNLSIAHRGASEMRVALLCAETAIGLDANHTDIWQHYGLLLRDAGDATHADIAFERASRARSRV